MCLHRDIFGVGGGTVESSGKVERERERVCALTEVSGGREG